METGEDNTGATVIDLLGALEDTALLRFRLCEWSLLEKNDFLRSLLAPAEYPRGFWDSMLAFEPVDEEESERYIQLVSSLDPNWVDTG